jgi:hypothetical protein
MNITHELTSKNRYELDKMADVFAAFVESYPSFNRTQLLDEWRETEYSRLDANGQIYLDYTGGGLYSESQLCELLAADCTANPNCVSIWNCYVPAYSAIPTLQTPLPRQ